MSRKDEEFGGGDSQHIDPTTPVGDSDSSSNVSRAESEGETPFASQEPARSASFTAKKDPAQILNEVITKLSQLQSADETTLGDDVVCLVGILKDQASIDFEVFERVLLPRPSQSSFIFWTLFKDLKKNKSQFQPDQYESFIVKIANVSRLHALNADQLNEIEQEKTEIKKNLFLRINEKFQFILNAINQQFEVLSNIASKSKEKLQEINNAYSLINEKIRFSVENGTYLALEQENNELKNKLLNMLFEEGEEQHRQIMDLSSQSNPTVPKDEFNFIITILQNMTELNLSGAQLDAVQFKLFQLSSPFFFLAELAFNRVSQVDSIDVFDSACAEALSFLERNKQLILFGSSSANIEIGPKLTNKIQQIEKMRLQFPEKYYALQAKTSAVEQIEAILCDENREDLHEIAKFKEEVNNLDRATQALKEHFDAFNTLVKVIDTIVSSFSLCPLVRNTVAYNKVLCKRLDEVSKAAHETIKANNNATEAGASKDSRSVDVSVGTEGKSGSSAGTVQPGGSVTDHANGNIPINNPDQFSSQGSQLIKKIEEIIGNFRTESQNCFFFSTINKAKKAEKLQNALDRLKFLCKNKSSLTLDGMLDFEEDSRPSLRKELNYNRLPVEKVKANSLKEVEKYVAELQTTKVCGTNILSEHKTETDEIDKMWSNWYFTNVAKLF